MIADIPSWDTIDITSAFYALFNLFKDIWVWSGTSYFKLGNETFSYRQMLAAGLVIACMFRAFDHIFQHDADADASIAYTQERFDNWG